MKSGYTRDKHSLLSTFVDSESLRVKAQQMLFMRQPNFVAFNKMGSFQKNLQCCDSTGLAITDKRFP